jgi:hypothetical protein
LDFGMAWVHALSFKCDCRSLDRVGLSSGAGNGQFESTGLVFQFLMACMAKKAAMPKSASRIATVSIYGGSNLM